MLQRADVNSWHGDYVEPCTVAAISSGAIQKTPAPLYILLDYWFWGLFLTCSRHRHQVEVRDFSVLASVSVARVCEAYESGKRKQIDRQSVAELFPSSLIGSALARIRGDLTAGNFDHGTFVRFVEEDVPSQIRAGTFGESWGEREGLALVIAVMASCRAMLQVLEEDAEDPSVQETQVDVFLSYSHNDRDCIERIGNWLRAAKIGVVYDRAMTGGSDLLEFVNSMIDRAKVVTVCWSRSSVSSNWVLGEALRAMDHGKIVPIALEPTAIPAPFNVLKAIPIDATTVLPPGEWYDYLDHIGPLLERVGLAEWAKIYHTPPIDARAFRKWIEKYPNDPMVSLTRQLIAKSESA